MAGCAASGRFLAALAAELTCNEHGSDLIGRLIEPHVREAAAREGYRVVPAQPRPVVMNTKGASASGKSTMRPLQRQLAEELGLCWSDFAVISPDIWRKFLLDYGSLGDASKYAATLTGHELKLIDQKLDRYMAQKAEHAGMSHLLIDRFRFDSFALDPDEEEGSRLLTRFGRLVYMFFMITPPEATVERAWIRGRQVGRYKAVDDLLAHNVEAYTGMPRLFFTWAAKKDKTVHYEFLDNDVPEGERPRTVAFGANGEMNILDIKRLIDVERYRKINVDARRPEDVYPDARAMAPERNLDFLLGVHPAHPRDQLRRARHGTRLCPDQIRPDELGGSGRVREGARRSRRQSRPAGGGAFVDPPRVEPAQRTAGSDSGSGAPFGAWQRFRPSAKVAPRLGLRCTRSLEHLCARACAASMRPAASLGQVCGDRSVAPRSPPNGPPGQPHLPDNGDAAPAPATPAEGLAFYAECLELLERSGLPYLLAARMPSTPIPDGPAGEGSGRFCRRDYPRILNHLQQAGHEIEVEDERWLAKVKRALLHGRHLQLHERGGAGHDGWFEQPRRSAVDCGAPTELGSSCSSRTATASTRRHRARDPEASADIDWPGCSPCRAVLDVLRISSTSALSTPPSATASRAGDGGLWAASGAGGSRAAHEGVPRRHFSPITRSTRPWALPTSWRRRPDG